MKTLCLNHILPALGLAVLTSNALAGEVQVPMAANFTAPMEQIAAAFKGDTGHRALFSDLFSQHSALGLTGT